jgi:hypothetical protein
MLYYPDFELFVRDLGKKCAKALELWMNKGILVKLFPNISETILHRSVR